MINEPGQVLSGAHIFMGDLADEAELEANDEGVGFANDRSSIVGRWPLEAASSSRSRDKEQWSELLTIVEFPSCGCVPGSDRPPESPMYLDFLFPEFQSWSRWEMP